MKFLKLALALCLLVFACRKVPFPYKGPYGHPSPPPPPPQEYDPSITEFFAHEGIDGDWVMIRGAHFGSTDTANLVKFNGLAAIIVSASTDSILVRVPDGVSTGKITVTVKGKTATTADDFVVLTEQGWTQKPNFPGGERAGSATFVLDGKAYLFGGRSAASLGANPLADLWVYDPLYDQWSRKLDVAINPNYFPSSPGRDGPIGFAIGHKGYIGLGNSNYIWAHDLYEYDPSTNQTTVKADFPGDPRKQSISFVIGNKAYVGLGYGTPDQGDVNASHWYNDFYSYDPSTDSWTRLHDYPGLFQPTDYNYEVRTTVAGSFAYAIGLADYNTGGGAEFWRYDPAADSWQGLPPFPGIKRSGFEIFSVRGKIYAGFGLTPFGSRNDFWVYDPQSAQWSQLDDCPDYKHSGGVSFVIGNRAYVGTGMVDSAKIATNQFWQFLP